MKLSGSDERYQEVLDQLIDGVKQEGRFAQHWKRDWKAVNGGLPINVNKAQETMDKWRNKLSADHQALADVDLVSTRLTEVLRPHLGLGGGTMNRVVADKREMLDGGELIFTVCEYLVDDQALQQLRKSLEDELDKCTYSGINRVLLNNKHVDRSYWLTFKQAQKCNYRVQAGSKGRKIKPPPPSPPKCPHGCPRAAGWWDNGCAHVRHKVLNYIKWPVVFNVHQIAAPASASSASTAATTVSAAAAAAVPFQQVDATWQRLMPPMVVKKELQRKFQQLLQNLQLGILPVKLLCNESIHRAYYSIQEKTIYMPEAKSFKSYPLFLYTLLHELGHALDHLVERPGLKKKPVPMEDDAKEDGEEEDNRPLGSSPKRQRTTSESSSATSSSASSSAEAKQHEDESCRNGMSSETAEQKQSWGELTAEITAGFLACKFGLELSTDDMANSAAYLRSWLVFLEEERAKLAQAERRHHKKPKKPSKKRKAAEEAPVAPPPTREETVMTVATRACQLADAFDRLFTIVPSL